MGTRAGAPKRGTEHSERRRRSASRSSMYFAMAVAVTFLAIASLVSNRWGV